MITNILLSYSDDNSVPFANFTQIPASVKEYIRVEVYI